MGCCLQPKSLQQTNATDSTMKERVDVKMPYPKMDAAAASSIIYSNSLTSNKRSNTHTMTLNSPASFTPPTIPKMDSLDANHQLLSDDDVFSREAIRVAHQFWNDNLLTLNANRRQEISVTLYAQMFRRMPQCRKIFLRHDIEKTSQQFLGMIGWLIMQLNHRNCEVWTKVKMLGKMHANWGITYEHYLPMLQAFHLTFQENFPKGYTLRVKFCIENLFMNAAKIMTGKDFVTLFQERVQDLETLEFLDSLDACLAHKTGREYFERYLEQTFCAEFVTFLKFFDEFKQLGNMQQRYETAREIYQTHFDINGRAPIEFEDAQHIRDAEELKITLDKYQRMLLMEEDEINQSADAHTAAGGDGCTQMTESATCVILTDNLLDEIYANIKTIIEEQSWDKFHTGIYSIKKATRIQHKQNV